MNPCFLNCQPFSVVLDALQDGVTIYDRDSTLIWVNSKACQIMGMPREELIGRNVSEIATLPTVEKFVDLVVPVLQKRGLFRQDYAGDT